MSCSQNVSKKLSLEAKQQNDIKTMDSGKQAR